MKILLVNPPRYEGRPVVREDRCEITVPHVVTPHGFIYLAGILLYENCNVDFIDANGYDLDFNYIRNKIEIECPEIVIFKCTPETFYSDIQVGYIAKSINNKIITVMICFSLTTVPRKVLEKTKYVDIFITDYDYEISILKLIRCFDFENIDGIAYMIDENIIVNPPNTERYNFSSLPLPAWHLIPDFNVYWTQIPSIRPCAYVESMKGCGMGCTFCTIGDVKPTFRDPKQVVDEIEYLRKRGVRYINFFDATIGKGTSGRHKRVRTGSCKNTLKFTIDSNSINICP